MSLGMLFSLLRLTRRVAGQVFVGHAARVNSLEEVRPCCVFDEEDNVLTEHSTG